jgi:hypothetical protein
MASVSDVSVEFGHVSLASLNKRKARLAARAAARWAMPVVNAYERAGLQVSTTILLDDYFARPGTDVAGKFALLSDACKEYDVRVDYLVLESEVARSVELLYARLGLGRRRTTPDYSSVAPWWLEDTDPAEAISLLARHDSERPTAPEQLPRDLHSVGLCLELFRDEAGSSSRRWSCAMLAAWWQLIRLGLLIDPQSKVAVAPPHTESRAGASAFPARRTLTLLEPRFLAVEHAVRSILLSTSLPDEWRTRIRKGDSDDQPADLLTRIAYIFVPTSFADPVFVEGNRQ